MFEITISSAKSKSKDISFIIEKIKPRLKDFNCIMVCEEFDGRVNLALATNENNKDWFLSVVFDVVCEAIIRGYKEEIIKNNMIAHHFNNLTLASFVKALTMFDKMSDKEYIMSKIKPSKVINIDSLFYFQLWELEKRWKNIAELISENSAYLKMSGMLDELMKFLITTNEVEFGTLYLNMGNGNIYAFGEDKREIFSFKYCNDDNCKISVVSEIINLSPKRIIINKNFCDQEMVRYLEFLYDGKISILK